MSNLDQARNTQLKNIETKTGQSLDQLREIVINSGLHKHGEIRQMLMDRFGLGYGDANTLVHIALASDGQSEAEVANKSTDDVLDEIYSGSKAQLRSIHAAVMGVIEIFGEFEIVPKKGYVSLRRKKQFVMIGPGSKGRLEIGLNMKGIEATERFIAQPAGGMCQFKVFLVDVSEVNSELSDWLRFAYSQAG
jgi:hypothetical protein